MKKKLKYLVEGKFFFVFIYSKKIYQEESEFVISRLNVVDVEK